MATVETLYKVLDDDRRSMHNGTGTWTPGRWRSARLPLIPCQRGLHVCALKHLPLWLGPAIWEVEVAGERIDQDDKIIVQRARITRQVETWNARTARLYAADCAEHVLHLFEHDYPNDSRPREAIRVARAFASGVATREELDAAEAAARDAVWGAARGAARGAAWAAATAAARDAAWGAAYAAWGAASAAAWAAAWAATGDAELQWQVERLGKYLRGEVA